MLCAKDARKYCNDAYHLEEAGEPTVSQSVLLLFVKCSACVRCHCVWQCVDAWNYTLSVASRLIWALLQLQLFMVKWQQCPSKTGTPSEPSVHGWRLHKTSNSSSMWDRVTGRSGTAFILILTHSRLWRWSSSPSNGSSGTMTAIVTSCRAVPYANPLEVTCWVADYIHCGSSLSCGLEFFVCSF